MPTVLIVDDEDGVIWSIRQTLENCGHQLVATTSPHDALRIVRTSTVDLLITDLFMPAMDGATLLKRSRQIRPELKVILTTGIASQGELRRWRARREVIISKPWLDKELLDAVAKALPRAPGGLHA